MRIGATVTTSYRVGTNWVTLDSAAATGSAVLGVGADAPAAHWAHRSTRVAFDNFVIDAERWSC